jgi:ABC-type oligopeptide transport system substrate-binding subunit
MKKLLILSSVILSLTIMLTSCNNSNEVISDSENTDNIESTYVVNSTEESTLDTEETTETVDQTTESELSFETNDNNDTTNEPVETTEALTSKYTQE